MKQSVDLKALQAELVARHGEAQRARIERGLEQVALLWRDLLVEEGGAVPDSIAALE